MGAPTSQGTAKTRKSWDTNLTGYGQNKEVMGAPTSKGRAKTKHKPLVKPIHVRIAWVKVEYFAKTVINKDSFNKIPYNFMIFRHFMTNICKISPMQYYQPVDVGMLILQLCYLWN